MYANVRAFSINYCIRMTKILSILGTYTCAHTYLLSLCLSSTSPIPFALFQSIFCLAHAHIRIYVARPNFIHFHFLMRMLCSCCCCCWLLRFIVTEQPKTFVTNWPTFCFSFPIIGCVKSKWMRILTLPSDNFAQLISFGETLFNQIAISICTFLSEFFLSYYSSSSLLAID